MKKVAGRLRLDLAQYRELSAFVQFASELDAGTRTQIEQGAKMVELLKQEQYKPFPVEEQVSLLWVGTTGKLEKIEVSEIPQFKQKYLSYLHQYGRDVLDSLRDEKKLTDSVVKKLEKVTADFLEEYVKDNEQ